MKKIAPFFLLFMTLSCGPDDNITPVVIPETYQERVTAVLNKSPETNPLEDSSLFFRNVSYGSAERNTYNILLPEDGNPIGLAVIFTRKFIFRITLKAQNLYFVS